MMGALGGFVVGYLLGTNAGKQGIENLINAANQIYASDEFKALVASGTSMAGALLGRFAQQGKGVLGAVVADQAKTIFDRRFLGSAA
jgi:hypothetical protein